MTMLLVEESPSLEQHEMLTLRRCHIYNAQQPMAQLEVQNLTCHTNRQEHRKTLT